MVMINEESLWTWVQPTIRRQQRPSSKRKNSNDSTGAQGDIPRLQPGLEEDGDSIADSQAMDEEAAEQERQWRRCALGTVTHLHLQRRGINAIEDISHCIGTRVLFLQHNKLQRINKLKVLQHLQELHLQDNCITRLEGLRDLHHLKKLLLGGNSIAVLEGLPSKLQELHIQQQKLPFGDSLVLDPHALLRVQNTLTLLDLCGNNLTELGAVGVLVNLKDLRARNNRLRKLNHISTVISRLNRLTSLELSGNPVCTHRRYQTEIILVAPPCLGTLDDKAINPKSRFFLTEAQKYQQSRQRLQYATDAALVAVESSVSAQEDSSAEDNRVDTHFLFTSACPPNTAAPGPRYVLSALKRPEFDLILNKATSRLSNKKLIDDSSEDRDGDCSENNNLQEDNEERVGVFCQGENALGDKVPSESEDDAGDSDLPRLIPRPYWRNKPVVKQSVVSNVG